MFPSSASKRCISWPTRGRERAAHSAESMAQRSIVSNSLVLGVPIKGTRRKVEDDLRDGIIGFMDCLMGREEAEFFLLKVQPMLQ